MECTCLRVEEKIKRERHEVNMDFKKQKNSPQPSEYLWINVLSAMARDGTAMANRALTSLRYFSFQDWTLVLRVLFCSFSVLAS